MQASKNIWIGPTENALGDFGFLISTCREGGDDKYRLSDTPAHTNQSHEPRLNGWCGSWNNVSTNACGMAKVIRIAKNGRCLVSPLEGDQLQAALDELGYPDLS